MVFVLNIDMFKFSIGLGLLESPPETMDLGLFAKGVPIFSSRIHWLIMIFLTKKLNLMPSLV